MSHNTVLLLSAVAAIAIIVLLIVLLKLHAFLALTIGSLFMGIAAGLGLAKTTDSFTKGVGTTLAGVGLILALGTMLGKLLAESGGANQIATTVLRGTGPRRVPWAMALIAMIVGIPLFFEVGVVLLLPIIFLMAQQVNARLAPARPEGPGARTAERPTLLRGSTYILVGIPALAGLSVLHGLVPPHPGPLIAIDALKADLGRTLLIGLVLAIPTVIVAGPLFATLAARWASPRPPADLIDQITSQHQEGEERNPPGFGVTLATVLLPVVLMLFRTVADVALPEDSLVRRFAEFVGTPFIALLISVLVAMWTFGVARGFSNQRVSTWLGASLAPAAGILLIIGAGGGFKQVLTDSGIGASIAKAANGLSISLLLLAWVVAVLIRLATGSATVATVTAAGIIAPIVANNASVSRPLLVLAIGAGSLFFSHVNDAGFWLVKEFFGMTVGETIKTWSIMETIISVVGIVLVLVASLVVG
jgi:gluconate:H+ symporter, GntP family